MKLHITALAATAFAAFILMASPALYADSGLQLAPEVQAGISFVSGGIGEDESMTFKRAAAGYPLELQFVNKATPRDEYLADVKVTIRDRTGNVLLDTVSAGPFLLAKLPAGSYQIEADHVGVVKRHAVDIRAGKHARAVFVWATPEQITSSMLSNSTGGSRYQ